MKYIRITSRVSYSQILPVQLRTLGQRLDNIPDIFRRMAEFAACYARTERKVADTDRVILELVREIILTLCHGSNKNAYALLRPQICDVISNPYNGCVETQCHLSTVGWQVLRNRVLNDLEKFLGRGRAADGEAVEELHHKTGEALEGTWDTDGRRHFN